MSGTALRSTPLWPARPARRRGPVVRTASSLLRWFAPIVGIYLVIVVAVAVVVPFVVDAAGDVRFSILWFARQSGVWFPFSVLIGVAVSYPAVHVANGMTRRAYVRGSLLAVTALAVGFAGTMTLGLLAERTWYRAMGWRWELAEGWFAPAEGLPTVLVAYLATFLVAYLSGLLVGTVYAAKGGWWGTLTLPLTVGPILLVTILVDNAYDWVPFSHLFGDAPSGGTPLALLVAVAVVLALALAAAFWLVAGRRPVPPRRG
ncbi:hypothetical protein KQI48_03945 [Cellulomonas hominis]|jgi:hypothetical protein|uniref:Uncharacterized membrane protein (DUF441 family) n=1 Tax=Cellulomonas hominis TaxID=156981 RepID=A0A511FC87_9CELL|nr:hypothetical protein [Cellulomonas hominis]MBB5472639.1 uncharacterized membrane protein (DUF441 family) [Cellulomonas hominis]MBU5421811.1 hypothetical protein [Cellulomonas hominis]GEL46859.1 hypothetical protein CHO01_19750 [Cellulomonas hominis]